MWTRRVVAGMGGGVGGGGGGWGSGRICPKTIFSCHCPNYYWNKLHFCGFYQCVNAEESLINLVKNAGFYEKSTFIKSAKIKLISYKYNAVTFKRKRE